MPRKEELQVEIILSDTKKAGKTLGELNKEAKLLRFQLNNLTPGTEKFVEKSKKLQEVTSQMKDIRGEINGTASSMDELNKEFGLFGPFEAILKKGTAAVKFLAGGFKTLRGAIISTGIGALIVALGALVTWLTTTQAGMDKLTSVMRPLQAIMSRALGLVQELGGKAFKGLSEAIKDPIGTLKELGQILLDNVINRFKAFTLFIPAIKKIMDGELKQGLSDLGDAAIQMSTGVEGAIGKIGDAAQATTKWVKDGIDAGTKLDQLTKDLERTEINLTKRRAELNKVFEESKFIAEDVTKSEDERINAARRALKAQDELLNLEQNFLDLKIEKAKVEQSLNDTSREDELELAALEAERTEFAAAAAGKRTGVRNLENTILAQISGKNKARLLEEKKLEEQLNAAKLKAVEDLEALQLSIMSDGAEKRIIIASKANEAELLKQQELFDNKIIDAQQFEEAKRILDLQLKQETDKIIEEEEAKHQAALKAEKDKALSDDLAAEDLARQNKANKIAEDGLNALISIQDQQAAELALAVQHEQNKLDILIASGTATEAQIAQQNAALLAAQKAQQNASVAAVKESEDKKKAIQQETFSIANDLLSLADGLESKRKDRQKKIIAAQQAAAIASVFVNLQQEIAGYFSTVDSVTTLGTAGAIKSAIAGARAAIAVSKIASQNPKFAKGGLIKGPSHQSGGINLVNNQTGQSIGEMEGNEIIMTSGVYRNPVLRAYASHINELGGGRKFALGGPVNPISSGTNQINLNTSSQKASNDSSQAIANANIEGTQQIVSAINQQTSIIQQWPRVLKVINDPRDTEEALSVVNDIKASVDV